MQNVNQLKIEQRTVTIFVSFDKIEVKPANHIETRTQVDGDNKTNSNISHLNLGWITTIEGANYLNHADPKLI